MAIPSFFKQTKPRGFNYAPRHYDPVREEREVRHRAMGLDAESREQTGKSKEHGARSREHGEGSMGDRPLRNCPPAGGQFREETDSGVAKESTGQKPFRRTITKGSMRDLYHHTRGRTQHHNSIRLIIIILILVLVTYLYLRF